MKPEIEFDIKITLQAEKCSIIGEADKDHSADSHMKHNLMVGKSKCQVTTREKIMMNDKSGKNNIAVYNLSYPNHNSAKQKSKGNGGNTEETIRKGKT